MPVHKPAPLAPGARIGVVAPAGCVEPASLLAGVAAIEAINRNFAEEDGIEEEARKMLASFAQASKDMDPFKMFLLAKQKLAAKKGFIL